MKKIHVMMLVRNEQSRLINGVNVFEEVLLNMQQLGDTITILDDNSDDGTVELIKKVIPSADVIENNERMWTVDERKVRGQLFDAVKGKANFGDWFVCFDGDELMLGEHIPYLKHLLGVLSPQIDAIGMKLYDMWSDTHYRSDNLWCIHNFFYPFIIRYIDKEYLWPDKKLHCGRLPHNSAQAMIPTMIPVKHMGWADKDERKKKYDRYMKTDPQGVHGIMAQYVSILDDNPSLVEFGRCPE